jgi:hypothetical protein
MTLNGDLRRQEMEQCPGEQTGMSRQRSGSAGVLSLALVLFIFLVLFVLLVELTQPRGLPGPPPPHPANRSPLPN